MDFVRFVFVVNLSGNQNYDLNALLCQAHLLFQDEL